MSDDSALLGDEGLERVRSQHQLVSAHRCRCGWEGDDAIVHIFDAINAGRPHQYRHHPDKHVCRLCGSRDDRPIHDGFRFLECGEPAPTGPCIYHLGHSTGLAHWGGGDRSAVHTAEPGAGS